MAGRPRRQAMIAELERLTAEYFEDDSVLIGIGKAEAHSTLDYLCARIKDGDTVVEIAEQLTVHRSWIMSYLDNAFGDAVVAQRLTDARAHASHSHAEQSVRLSDEAAETSVDVARNGLRARSRQWMAERWNQAAYGQSKGVSVSVSIGSLHLDALRARHTEVTGSLKQVADASSTTLAQTTQPVAIAAVSVE